MTHEILLVEDNPADVRLAQEAFEEAEVANNMHVVSDGEEAISYLRMHDSNNPWPDLILLDLNLPKKDGRQVLAELKADETLRRIPVVIFTTSHAPNDITNAYDNYANCYITKPIDFEQFIDVVKSIEYFWLTTAKLPRIE